MMCKSPPNSPIGSEISVGSPSPPAHCDNSDNENNKDEYFQPLKKLKMMDNEDPKNLTDASPTIVSNNMISPSSTTRCSSKTTVEGVKSFSIADILGRDSTNNNNKNSSNKFTRDNTITQLAQTLQQSARIVRPWDQFQHPITIRPLFPPALLHYEQRLAFDYHQQLQEHFRVQAQLLRQMNMDIVPSESGSDRSSSVASDCCSPEIGRSSENSGTPQKSFSSQEKAKARDKSPNNNNTGSIYNKPLDALFQLSNKNFDEQCEGGECALYCCVLYKRIEQEKQERKANI